MEDLPLTLTKHGDLLEFVNVVFQECKGDHCESDETLVNKFHDEIAYEIRIFQK